MKILQINKFWYNHGGADLIAIDLAADLKARGHSIGYFGMQDDRNIKTDFDQYFVEPIHTSKKDFETRGNFFQKAKDAGKIVYSYDAARKLDALLSAWRPDVAHLHNIYHHLSPSIIGVLRRHKIPIVQTLHDYKRMCPNHAMFTQGSVCERCKGHKFWNAVKYRCVFDSSVASAIVATEMGVQSMFGWYDSKIDHFIASSHFMKTKLAEWGRNTDNMTVVPTGISVPTEPLPQGTRVLFNGRLSKEKGVDVLFAAAKKLPHILFDVAGGGPLENELAQMKLPNVTLHGHKTREEIMALAGHAVCTVVPSVWYENYPLAVLEMMAAGKAVIGSDRGGIPELINETTGILVPPGDSSALLNAIEGLVNDPVRAGKLGAIAREKVIRENDLDDFLDAHEQLYQKLI